MSFVGDLVGELTGANAAQEGADKAADAQVKAAQLGIDEQRRQFDFIQNLLSPFVNAAVGGSRTYTPTDVGDLIDTSQGGWRPNAELYANDASYKNAWDQFSKKHMDMYGVAPNLSRQSDLAQAQRELAGFGFNIDDYNAAQKAAFDAQPRQKGSLEMQLDLLGLNGPEAQKAAIDGIEGGSMFSSLFKQGENSILQNASATGGLRGGNTQSALAQFRPQLLNQLINQQYSQLGGITGLGQNSAAGVGNAGMATGNNISSLLQQQGAARAGQAIAQGNTNASNIGGVGQLLGTVGSFFF